VQNLSSQSDQRWPNSVRSIRDTWNRVRPGTCDFWGVCGLAGTPSKENAGENPYSRGVRDVGGSSGDSGRDGPGSIELQRAFEATNSGRRDVKSTLAE